MTIHYAQTNGIKIKGIIVNKVPLLTNDLATQNFIKELTMYTDTKILGTINEMEDSTSDKLAEEFSKFIKNM